MIGAIVGDVLGSWFEVWSTKEKDVVLFQDLAHVTDDSVLTLAVARTILESTATPSVDDYQRRIRQDARRYPDAGYGGTFRRWVADDQMGPYDSWGNGSAMRVSPVGWAFETEEEVLEQARRTALPTHNHPEGVKGAQAVALAVFMARKGASKEALRIAISDRFGYDLSRTIEEIRPEYKFDVSCQGSVPEAIVAFLDSNDFEDAVRNAISLGGDADTQACIAGALAEAHYGGVPAKFLAYVLPRLDDTLLSTVTDFATRYMPAEAATAAEGEGKQRRVAGGGGRVPGSPPYRVVISGQTWDRIEAYRRHIKDHPQAAGRRLQRALDRLPLPAPDGRWFLQALLDTKAPQIFAESAVRGDGSDWTAAELGILGDVGVAVPVTIFDDGRHSGPLVHEQPLRGTLLFVPGALLQNGCGETPADWSVVQDGAIERERYEALYERRLCPLLSYANSVAQAEGRTALVTIPGLGCGQFAGPFYGRLGPYLRDALLGIVGRHVDELTATRAIWFDPYGECENDRREIGPISFFVRPLQQGPTGRPQLCPPRCYGDEGDDFSDCRLFSVVAWDHVSWPGNDFYGGARCTDDGVKAAATDTMFAMTGFRGVYNPARHVYRPPAGCSSWKALVQESSLRIQVQNNLVIVRTSAGGAEAGADDGT